jgi:hypothetical protein
MSYDIIIGRDKEDKKKFGKKGIVYIGKGYVTMGNYTSLSNKIWMDIARTHVIMIAGKRGSGKSYSIGVLAEELSDLPEEERKNIAPLIFDTMGIFWTMRYKNEKEIELLEEWDLKTKSLPIAIWVPIGYFDEFQKKEIPADKKFALAVSELSIEDWISIFKQDMISPASILIQKIISELVIEKTFDIEDIIEKIKKEENTDEDTRKSAISLFEAAKSWRIFAEKNDPPTKIEDLIIPGKTTVLDMSMYSSTATFNVRALIIGLICKKLFNQRMMARKKEEVESIQHGINTSYQEKKEMPLVWLFLDEAH